MFGPGCSSGAGGAVLFTASPHASSLCHLNCDFGGIGPSRLNQQRLPSMSRHHQWTPGSSRPAAPWQRIAAGAAVVDSRRMAIAIRVIWQICLNLAACVPIWPQLALKEDINLRASYGGVSARRVSGRLYCKHKTDWQSLRPPSQPNERFW